MLTLRTLAFDDSHIVREWQESPETMTAEWYDHLVDQEMWDYEQFGATHTYIVLPSGLVRLHVLDLPQPSTVEAR